MRCNIQAPASLAPRTEHLRHPGMAANVTEAAALPNAVELTSHSGGRNQFPAHACGIRPFGPCHFVHCPRPFGPWIGQRSLEHRWHTSYGWTHAGVADMGPDDAVRLCIADCTIAAVPGKPWRGAGQDSQNPERHIRMPAAARVHLQACAQSLEQPKWWTIRNRGHVADAQTFRRSDLHLAATSPAHSTQLGRRTPTRGCGGRPDSPEWTPWSPARTPTSAHEGKQSPRRSGARDDHHRPPHVAGRLCLARPGPRLIHRTRSQGHRARRGPESQQTGRHRHRQAKCHCIGHGNGVTSMSGPSHRGPQTFMPCGPVPQGLVFGAAQDWKVLRCPGRIRSNALGHAQLLPWRTFTA